MAGDQELHALAQHQLIAHALAIAVTSIHQDLQQIVAGRLLTPPPNVVEQNAVGARSHFIVFAQFARDRKPGIQVGLNGLTDHKFLDDRDGPTDEVDVVVFQPGAKQRPADHLEGNFHQEGVNIDGAEVGLSVEILQRLREGILHDRGQNVQLFSIETLLDEAPLRAPDFPVAGEKTFAEEVAHPLHLNFGFVVVLRISLQHVLNDDRIGSYDGLSDAAKVEPEMCRRGVRCTWIKPVRDCWPSRANPRMSAIGKRPARFGASLCLAAQALQENQMMPDRPPHGGMLPIGNAELFSGFLHNPCQ